mgnify:CR=1 FL=1
MRSGVDAQLNDVVVVILKRVTRTGALEEIELEIQEEGVFTPTFTAQLINLSVLFHINAPL